MGPREDRIFFPLNTLRHRWMFLQEHNNDGEGGRYSTHNAYTLIIHIGLKRWKPFLNAAGTFVQTEGISSTHHVLRCKYIMHSFRGSILHKMSTYWRGISKKTLGLGWLTNTIFLLKARVIIRQFISRVIIFLAVFSFKTYVCFRLKVTA